MGADFQSPPIQAFQPKVNNSVLVVNPTLLEVEVKHSVPVCGIYLIAVIKLLRDPPSTAHSCVWDVSPRVPQQNQQPALQRGVTEQTNKEQGSQR